MRFGVLETALAREPARAVDACVEAEAQGYASAWLGETASDRGAAAVLASHLSGRTARIRIGLGLVLDGELHPLRVAEDLAMLDVVSSGRLEWAADPGGEGAEAEGRLREQLAVIRHAWSGERFSHDGAFFSFPELVCPPSPVQQPPPFWVTARTRSVRDWAAREGHPVMLPALVPLPPGEGERERPSARPLVACAVHVGASQRRAREAAEPALRAALARSARGPGAPAEGIGADDLLERHAVVGDEVCCRERIAALRERTGLEVLLTWHRFGGVPDESARDSQRRFAEDVAPGFA